MATISQVDNKKYNQKNQGKKRVAEYRNFVLLNLILFSLIANAIKFFVVSFSSEKLQKIL